LRLFAGKGDGLSDAGYGPAMSLSLPHHPVFEAFTPFRGEPEGMATDALGARTRPHFIAAETPPPGAIQTYWPAPCEEYFEWIDLLEAVRAARGGFTMLELGAGFGRWACRGALAARALGIGPIRLGLAEADAQHAQWLVQHMADNAIGTDEYRLYEAAVTDRAGTINFFVSTPDVDGIWYGQSACDDEIDGLPVVRDYFGKPVVRTPEGAELVQVPQIPLSAVLADFDFIDFADLDLQGSEADAVEEALAPLAAKVRRLHIGTHRPGVERRLRELLGSAGWTLVRDYGCQSDNDTEYGRFAFNDGVQTWLNPRL
jgi:FkbM family methyltransferase